MTSGRQNWPTWLTSLLVAAVVCVVYAPVTQFAFLPYWDDNQNVLLNQFFHPVSPGHFARFWLAPFENLYVPVTYSFWMLQAWLAEDGGVFNPAVFHVCNLLTHAGTAALVFLLLRSLLLQFAAPGLRLEMAAAAGALLFALHPLQIEAVAWVTGFRDLLGAFFGVLALWLYLRYSGRWTFYFLATAAFLLALGAKPGMVAVPPVALLLGLWPMRFSRRRLLLTLMPWFLIGALWSVLTVGAQPVAALARDLVPAWSRPLVALDGLTFYLGKLVWPLGLSADYGRAPNVVWQSGALFWTWLIPAAVGFALGLVRSARWGLFALGIFVVSLAPTLGLVPFNFQLVSTVADRYAYFGMLGPSLAIAVVLLRGPRWSMVCGGVVLAGLAVLTGAHLPVWADSRQLYQSTLAANPASWKTHQNYGDVLDELGDYPQAALHLEESLRLWPNSAEGWNDLAAVYGHLGRLDQALEAFRNSFKIRPTSATVHNLAQTLLQAGKPDEAAQAMREALTCNLNDPETARYLAWLLATYPQDRARNGAQALQIARQLVQTQTPSGLLLVTLAAALAECNQFPEAVEQARAATLAFQNLGDARGAQFVDQLLLPALLRREKIRDNNLLHPLQAEMESAARRRR